MLNISYKSVIVNKMLIAGINHLKNAIKLELTRKIQPEP